MTKFDKALEYVKKEFPTIGLEQQTRIAKKMVNSDYSWIKKIVNA